MSKDLKNKWAQKATKIFSGKTIARVRYPTDTEIENMMWDEAGPVLVFTDGSWMMASQDDEGNGPGALFTSDTAMKTIPIIR
jgi:hypothetical protein